MSRTFKAVFFLYWGLIYIFRLVLILDFFRTGDGQVLWTTGYFSDLLSIVYLFTIFGYAIFRSKYIKEGAKRGAVKTFGLIYFFCFAFFNLSNYFSGSTGTFLLSFLYPIPPLVYMYLHLRKYFREHAALPGKGTVMEAIFPKYNISPREQEIIRLISRGKSNQEISDLLFISLQTVKHHIHSIYRKLNVSNRVQLSNFFRNALQ